MCVWGRPLSGLVGGADARGQQQVAVTLFALYLKRESDSCRRRAPGEREAPSLAKTVAPLATRNNPPSSQRRDHRARRSSSSSRQRGALSLAVSYLRKRTTKRHRRRLTPPTRSVLTGLARQIKAPALGSSGSLGGQLQEGGANYHTSFAHWINLAYHERGPAKEGAGGESEQVSVCWPTRTGAHDAKVAALFAVGAFTID